MSKLYDEKFEKQVKHLSGFIGMPMWNGRNPTLQEIREYDRRVLEQQAKGFKPKRKSVLKRVFVWLTTSTTNVSTPAVKASSNTIKKTDEKKRELKESVALGSACCH